jgi:hypothetical protein
LLSKDLSRDLIVEEKTTSSLPHLLMKEQQERVFERHKCKMQRKQKMRLSQLALVPYDKDEKRPTTRGESDSAANKRRFFMK